jgi:hypothetical protein
VRRAEFAKAAKPHLLQILAWCWGTEHVEKIRRSQGKKKDVMKQRNEAEKGTLFFL